MSNFVFCYSILLIWSAVVLFGWLIARYLWNSFQKDDLKRLETVESVKHGSIQRAGLGQGRVAINLKAEGLGLRLPTGRVLLRDVTASFKNFIGCVLFLALLQLLHLGFPGRVCAIMGPSGSGKTTFLNVLSGRFSVGRASGRLLINNREDTIAKYRRLVGFVPQDDVLLADLTVGEVLRTSAFTRLPSHMSHMEREKMVEKTLRVLGLSGLRYQMIGDVSRKGLSGGQKKRVSIAMELVADPVLLTLDEPTSGLDATSSMDLIKSLRDLARAGLTVIAVIHQPRYEIFELFDDVLLLAKGGRTVYCGATSEVSKYFSDLGYVCPAKVNPADFYLDVINENYEQIHERASSGDAVPRTAQVEGESRNSSESSSSGPEEAPSANKLAVLVDPKCQDSKQIPQDLATLWSQKENDERGAESNASVPPVNYEEAPGNDLEVTSLRYARKERNIGEAHDFMIWFLVCLCLPWALWKAFHCFGGESASLYARFGGLFGACSIMILIGIMMAAFSDTTDIVVVGVLLIVSFVVLAAAIGHIFVKSVFQRKYRQGTFVAHFILGIITGPFVLFVIYCLSRLSQKVKTALYCGFMFDIVYFGSYLFISGTIGEANNSEASHLFSVLCVVIFVLIAFAILVTYFMRYNQMPHFERQTTSFHMQTLVFLKRGLIQQLRNGKGIVFDIGLMFFAGLFLGVVFYDRRYVGTMLSPYGIQIGDNVGCPAELKELYPALCMFALVPLADPIIAESSLCCLAIAMAAVASAMRIFGDEKDVFFRESRTGLNTEAYYIGKSLAHLPIILIGPFVFLFAFAGLAPIQGNLGMHYCTLTLVYFTASGLAYCVSIIVRRSLTQLVGVMALLVTMTFSGANPTLLQLKHNALLGEPTEGPNAVDPLIPVPFLWYLSFPSFLRWLQELFYLTEIKSYGEGEASMSALYGYRTQDFALCITLAIAIAVVFRLIAYILLVYNEHH